jgi:hypothetical protein
MEIKPSTSRDRINLFIETLLGMTDNVSKVSKHSTLSGIAGGVAKVAGKAEKDIVLALSELFPENSYGTKLDRAHKNFGITERLGALNSSTYVRVTADPGTTYYQGVQKFASTEGPLFSLVENVVVPQEGFAYCKVQSDDTGAVTNVAPLTINRVLSQPSSHLNVINEVRASGGRDIEDDNTFKARGRDSGNLFARGTLGLIEQVCIKANPKVLKLFNYGLDNNGKRVLAVVTVNGTDLTQTELDTLLTQVAPFLSLTDGIKTGTNYIGVKFKNVEYQPIDISFRVVLDGSVNPDDIRRDIQIAISKYLDLRTFDSTRDRVEWDNLLQIVKNTSGVKYVPDQSFYPRVDVNIHPYKLPRLRGFLMLNTDGTIITNLNGTLSPVFYPAEADFSFISTVLQNM